jgi:1-phosphatidylinositol-3-phosphate 5-kinase
MICSYLNRRSSADYQQELAGMSSGRTASSVQPGPSPLLATSNQSFFGSKLFSSSSAVPDPDQEGIVWHEPDTYSAVISRKEHPRDHVSLLSLRDVLRNKVPADDGQPSRFGNMEGSRSHNVSGVMPPSAWAKPEVEINKHAVGADVSGSPKAESASGLLQEMEASSVESSQAESISRSNMSTSQFGEAHIHRGKASSLLSGDNDLTVGPEEGDITDPPALPPKDIKTSPAETGSFFTNSITNAMRYMLSVSDTKNQHSHLSGESHYIDDRPHIKYDWMIGKRLKFSCTVYYAKQFDGLRRRCGIEDIFLKSLERSANWAAEGGKSKSDFWKTSDNRFIMKTLVNAWNVADL